MKLPVLTSRQQGALPIIAAAPTTAQAARNARVSEATIRRWKQDPAFAQQLECHRRALADEATQQSLGLILEGIALLAEAMRDHGKTLRLRATPLPNPTHPRYHKLIVYEHMCPSQTQSHPATEAP